uniref:Uncharacterized protein n=1 Tax=Siphoviridae sp. ct8wU2 TaxID=2827791 RepID=A0A8S5SYC3_9CAUD|nr:MAG TPA: hypothetical protein [Siphoviridae sp. ct8wU2]DAL20796.1 MAG TPA_asm: hypothetical protein [Caudoviricetes sp.]DAL37677.1 MAG TPA_asm: hypothetical protein [Caudoviricetes sp.]
MTALIYFLPLPGVGFCKFLPRRNRTPSFRTQGHRTAMRRVRQG